MEKPRSMTAFGRNMNVSAKDARELCKELQGMTVSKAKKYLADVVALKQVVPYTRHVKEVPHQKGIACGRWPKKAAGVILKLVESAKANAEQIGKEEEGLFIKSIFTSRGNFRRGYGGARAMHRRGRHRSRAASVSITLAEVEGYVPKAKPKKEEKPKEKTVEPKVETKEEKPQTETEVKVKKEEEKTEKWLKKVNKE